MVLRDRPPRVFIDTSKLFPFTIMDVLLTLSEDLLFTWIWTDEVLHEWEEVIVRHGVRSEASAAAVLHAVRTYFGPYRIDPNVYRPSITDDLSPDPSDRVHAAAAIFGEADVLVTRNIKHLNTPPVIKAGVEVITSDEFLCALLRQHPQSVLESFLRGAGTKRSPSIAPRELAARLGRAGAPRFAALIRAHLPE